MKDLIRVLLFTFIFQIEFLNENLHAARQEETRLDIIRAAIELHSTFGTARLTVNAIAKQARGAAIDVNA